MERKDEKKQFNIIVTGLDIIDRAYDNANKETLLLEEEFPKFEKKENRKGPLYLLVTVVLMVVLGVVSSVLEDYTILAIVFFGGITALVNIVLGMPKATKLKIDARKSEIERNKNKADYISNTKQAINILLEKKDRLYDFFFTPDNNGLILTVVVPEEDESYEEVGKFYNIFITDLKIINDDKYSALIIEEDNKYSLGYRTTMIISYSLYKESATWLR